MTDNTCFGLADGGFLISGSLRGITKVPEKLRRKGLLPPEKPKRKGFNPKATLPFGVRTVHIQRAMGEFIDFLGFIDRQLAGKSMARIEEMLMRANFSSMVGEFVATSIPKHCKTIVRNRFHNGHPDLLPARKYKGDAAQHAGADGIEVKASRYLRGWQRHNPEDVWLLVFVFESGRPSDRLKGQGPVRFRFLMVAGARLTKKDWLFAGRSKTSRRTITASVTRSGYKKIIANWIYRCEELRKGKVSLVARNGNE